MEKTEGKYIRDRKKVHLSMFFLFQNNDVTTSPVLTPLSVTQRSALAERGSRDNCVRMLVILASFLANRYCACTTR